MTETPAPANDLWDASPGVCCAAFQLGACEHTEVDDVEDHRYDADADHCVCGGEVVWFEDGDDDGVVGYGCEAAGRVYPDRLTNPGNPPVRPLALNDAVRKVRVRVLPSGQAATLVRWPAAGRSRGARPTVRLDSGAFLSVDPDRLERLETPAPTTSEEES